jgi:hypothetical protein
MLSQLDGKLAKFLFVTYFLYWSFLLGFMTYVAFETGSLGTLSAVICAGFACSVVMIFQHPAKI